MPLEMNFSILESLYQALTDPNYFNENKKSKESPQEKLKRLEAELLEIQAILQETTTLDTERARLESELKRTNKMIAQIQGGLAAPAKKTKTVPEKAVAPISQVEKFSHNQQTCLKWLLARPDILCSESLGIDLDCRARVEQCLSDHFSSLMDAEILSHSKKGLILEGIHKAPVKIPPKKNTVRFYCNLITMLYPEHGGLDIQKMLIVLHRAFKTEADALSYLKNSVTYTNKETVERSFDIQVPDLERFPEAEREFWYFVNNTLGRPGLHFCVNANELRWLPSFQALLENYKNLDPRVLNRILGELCNTIIYPNASENPLLAEFCYKHKIPNASFEKALDFIKNNRVKNSDKLPEIKQSFRDGKKDYSIEKLPAGDYAGLFLGYLTDCCQSIDGDSHRCVEDGMTKDSAGFYVIRDNKGAIVAQSYAWLGIDAQGQRCLVLDSFEPLSGKGSTFIPAVQALRAQLLLETPLYVGIGGKTPKTKAQIVSAPEPLDSELFLYGDSRQVFEITKDIGVESRNNPTLAEQQTLVQKQTPLPDTYKAFVDLQENFIEKLRKLLHLGFSSEDIADFLQQSEDLGIETLLLSLSKIQDADKDDFRKLTREFSEYSKTKLLFLLSSENAGKLLSNLKAAVCYSEYYSECFSLIGFLTLFEEKSEEDFNHRMRCGLWIYNNLGKNAFQAIVWLQQDKGYDFFSDPISQHIFYIPEDKKNQAQAEALQILIPFGWSSLDLFKDFLRQYQTKPTDPLLFSTPKKSMQHPDPGLDSSTDHLKP